MARRGSDLRLPGPGRIILVATALAAAIVPFPADAIERYYSRGFYAVLQVGLTSITNLVPFAILDLAGAALVIVLLARLRGRGLRGAVRVSKEAALALVTVCAALYLVFLATWGLNYRRVPLDRKLAFDRSRVSRDAALTFGRQAVSAINEGYAAAHREPADVRRLAGAFRDAQRLVGGGRAAVPGRPKVSLLGLYFRWAAIDGMTDPFFLEVILNPDVLPVEEPFVLAHEWAHLAGYANESEASFLGWLTCLRGDAAARYSGWLAIYGHVVASLPRDDRRAMLGELGDGPRQDLAAISARVSRSAPLVRDAARGVYDSYLRANRVPEGIASYDAVVQLILGAQFEPGWTPVVR